MKAETAGKIKYGIWSLILGAVVAMVVGFGWGGWTTAATTQKMSDQAVLASQAAICVAQFVKQPNHEEKLKELEKVSNWDRNSFIEKGGWDKMPGQEKADYGVSRACVDGLELLITK
jgi:nucleoid-associated protein YgaU